MRRVWAMLVVLLLLPLSSLAEHNTVRRGARFVDDFLVAYSPFSNVYYVKVQPPPKGSQVFPNADRLYYIDANSNIIRHFDSVMGRVTRFLPTSEGCYYTVETINGDSNIYYYNVTTKRTKRIHALSYIWIPLAYVDENLLYTVDYNAYWYSTKTKEKTKTNFANYRLSRGLIGSDSDYLYFATYNEGEFIKLNALTGEASFWHAPEGINTKNNSNWIHRDYILDYENQRLYTPTNECFDVSFIDEKNNVQMDGSYLIALSEEPRQTTVGYRTSLEPIRDQPSIVYYIHLDDPKTVYQAELPPHYFESYLCNNKLFFGTVELDLGCLDLATGELHSYDINAGSGLSRKAKLALWASAIAILYISIRLIKKRWETLQKRLRKLQLK